VLDPQKRTRDIWTFDVARGVRSRVTLGSSDDNAAIWSPDGKEIVFNSRTKGYLDLFERDLNSADAAVSPLLSDARDKTPTSWSSDGRFLLYTAGGIAVGNNDVWLLPMTGDAGTRTPAPFLHTPFNESNARFSPDGKWVAYVSNETGQNEVYVTRFSRADGSGPAPNGKWPVSPGNYPRWSADGKEIFFVRNGTLMDVPVNAEANEFQAGTPRSLIDLHAPGAGYSYDVAANGHRFLVNTLVEATALPPITLVVNWTGGLRKP
jgi:Tol biopolymer transport system component